MNVKIIYLQDYLSDIESSFPGSLNHEPWDIIQDIQNIILAKIKTLGSDYTINNNIAIHKTSTVEEGVIIKGSAIISPGCFVGAHAYLRGGVYIGNKSVVGPGCEVKSSIILNQSALAHFNFVGDSIVGSFVNMEAGSILANHFNEREDKTIFVRSNEKTHHISSEKFGSLVGDYSKIGANAVLSPGTILMRQSIVKRLELVDQHQ